MWIELLMGAAGVLTTSAALAVKNHTIKKQDKVTATFLDVRSAFERMCELYGYDVEQVYIEFDIVYGNFDEEQEGRKDRVYMDAMMGFVKQHAEWLDVIAPQVDTWVKQRIERHLEVMMSPIEKWDALTSHFDFHGRQASHMMRGHDVQTSNYYRHMNRQFKRLIEAEGKEERFDANHDFLQAEAMRLEEAKKREHDMFIEFTTLMDHLAAELTAIAMQDEANGVDYHSRVITYDEIIAIASKLRGVAYVATKEADLLFLAKLEGMNYEDARMRIVIGAFFIKHQLNTEQAMNQLFEALPEKLPFADFLAHFGHTLFEKPTLPAPEAEPQPILGLEDDPETDDVVLERLTDEFAETIRLHGVRDWQFYLLEYMDARQREEAYNSMAGKARTAKEYGYTMGSLQRDRMYMVLLRKQIGLLTGVALTEEEWAQPGYKIQEMLKQSMEAKRIQANTDTTARVLKEKGDALIYEIDVLIKRINTAQKNQYATRDFEEKQRQRANEHKARLNYVLSLKKLAELYDNPLAQDTLLNMSVSRLREWNEEMYKYRLNAEKRQRLVNEAKPQGDEIVELLLRRHNMQMKKRGQQAHDEVMEQLEKRHDTLMERHMAVVKKTEELNELVDRLVLTDAPKQTGETPHVPYRFTTELPVHPNTLETNRYNGSEIVEIEGQRFQLHKNLHRQLNHEEMMLLFSFVRWYKPELDLPEDTASAFYLEWTKTAERILTEFMHPLHDDDAHPAMIPYFLRYYVYGVAGFDRVFDAYDHIEYRKLLRTVTPRAKGSHREYVEAEAVAALHPKGFDLAFRYIRSPKAQLDKNESTIASIVYMMFIVDLAKKVPDHHGRSNQDEAFCRALLPENKERIVRDMHFLAIDVYHEQNMEEASRFGRISKRTAYVEWFIQAGRDFNEQAFDLMVESSKAALKHSRQSGRYGDVERLKDYFIDADVLPQHVQGGYELGMDEMMKGLERALSHFTTQEAVKFFGLLYPRLVRYAAHNIKANY